MSIQLSLVELGTLAQGQTHSEAIENIVETAQQIEQWGYHRIWLAEHHNTANFVSRAPEVTIPLVAAKTSSIRVGSGSVLLNHYSPFKVAEVFTLLADMFPGRIDMGIGRATTGPVSDFALQRNRSIQQNNEDSEEQLRELVDWMTEGFPKRNIFSHIKARHEKGNMPEFWLLGSSQWSAYMAGSLGLNYSFAGFINPDQAFANAQRYRDNFTPAAHSLGGTSPRLMLSLSIYCADTLEDAAKLAAPMVLMMHRMRQGDINSPIETEERAVALLGGLPSASKLSNATIPPRYLIGTPETIREDVMAIAAAFDTEEIMVQCISNSMANRLKCLELLAKLAL